MSSFLGIDILSHFLNNLQTNVQIQMVMVMSYECRKIVSKQCQGLVFLFPHAQRSETAIAIPTPKNA